MNSKWERRGNEHTAVSVIGRTKVQNWVRRFSYLSIGIVHDRCVVPWQKNQFLKQWLVRDYAR